MKFFLFALILSAVQFAFGQSSNGSFVVNGENDKYYPVVFKDNGWESNQPTEIQIGRSSTHEDFLWNGSIMANFRIHTMMWGHGSHFIEATIYQRRHDLDEIAPFIAGYHDATISSNNRDFVIWLKGMTTYHFTSNFPQSPRVFDNVQHQLPYQQENGAAHTFKTEIDEYVQSNGMNLSGHLSVLGAGNNYFAGNIGIGTRVPTEKLEVNGKIRAKEIKVEVNNWPDYVFEEDYLLPSLTDTKEFIKLNKHLPGVPKAHIVADQGLAIGEMNKILLQKIEELTLHVISLSEELDNLKRSK
ncbi:MULTISPECIES: tail fiber protein [Sphingobacterium]|uniref:tail fiber protein n=1 Tax=Sphingobacterium TaxID=28453 RepID=UPI00257EB30D|nr:MULTISPECIES: tail fiber protein [Sphingobacterium]